MLRQKHWQLLFGAALIVMLGGCTASGSWLRNVERPLHQNQPDLALQVLEQNGNTDGLALYLVHKGMLLRMVGDIEGSIHAFETAKPLITFQEATSISELASSLVLTEGLGGYQPPPYEQVQLHFYQALNRLDVGDVEGARIEAMQIDILLERRWGGSAPFGSDAPARFLTGLIFEANGEPDNALIAYRKAYQSYSEHGHVGGVPAELQRRLLRLTRVNGLHNEFEKYAEAFGKQRQDEAIAALRNQKAHGELVLVAGTGLVPHRYEEVAMHMDPASGTTVAIALPSLSSPSNTISGVGLRLNGSVLARGEPIADLAALTSAQLEDELPGLIAKSIARNVAKAIAAQEAQEQFGLFGGLMVNIAGAAMEAADIRSWSTLPQHIQVASVALEPGTYTDLGVDYYGTNGQVATQALGREVRVHPGAPTVLSVHRVSP